MNAEPRRRKLPASTARRAMGILVLVALAGPLTVQGQAGRGAQSPALNVASYLRGQLGFSDGDVARLAAGEVITRQLAGATKDEIAFVGAARIAASVGAVVERLQDPRIALSEEGTVRLGALSAVPAPADLAALTLPPQDLDLLRTKCVAGACKLKLPLSLIERMRAAGPAEPGGEARVNSLMREWLLEYARGYLARGNDALVVYGDKPTPLPLHEGFHALLAQFRYLPSFVVEFHRYLEDFPRAALPGAQDALNWALTDIGLRPVITLTHATFYERAPGASPRALVALKQIYASHYFLARLRILVLIDGTSAAQGGGAGGASSYLVYVDRSLFDSSLGWFVRRQVEARMRASLQSRIETIRRSVGGSGGLAPGRAGEAPGARAFGRMGPGKDR